MTDVTTLRTAEQVLRAIDEHGWELVDLHVMDEFTHDWVVRTPAGWLVFDTT